MNLFSQFLVECLPQNRYGINGYYTQQSKHVSISTSSSSSVFHLRSNTELYVLSQNPLYLMHYYFNRVQYSKLQAYQTQYFLQNNQEFGQS